MILIVIINLNSAWKEKYGNCTTFCCFLNNFQLLQDYLQVVVVLYSIPCKRYNITINLKRLAILFIIDIVPNLERH